MGTYTFMRFRVVKKGGTDADSSNYVCDGDDRFERAQRTRAACALEFKAVLGAVYSALRPYPEACAAVERVVSELLESFLLAGGGGGTGTGGGEKEPGRDH